MANVVTDAFRTLVSMTENREDYEVNDDEKAEFSSEQQSALENATNLAKKIEGEQSNSIHISMNELVIRANNAFELFCKKLKINNVIKKIIGQIDQASVKNKVEDLPKKGFVKQAEEERVEVDSKKAIKEAREHGGHDREERIRR